MNKGKTLPVLKSIDYEASSKGSSVCLLSIQPIKALKTGLKKDTAVLTEWDLTWREFYLLKYFRHSMVFVYECEM